VADCFHKAVDALKEAAVSSLTAVLNNNPIFQRGAAWRVYPKFPVFRFWSADESLSNHRFRPVLGKVISNLVDLKIDRHVSPDCTASDVLSAYIRRLSQCYTFRNRLYVPLGTLHIRGGGPRDLP
jgi:hypothetical protein